MRVLITVPDLLLPGGVTSLYNTLNMEQHYNNISYFNVNGKGKSMFRFPLIYISFIIKLRSVDLVHLNPTLDRKSFLRDAVFAWLTLLFSKKLIVYWHGWETTYEQKIINNKFLNWIIRNTFLKAKLSIVLGHIFEKKLKNLGFQNKIAIETGCVDNKYNNNPKPKIILDNEPIILLFLSRLEKEKGIYIAIETLRELNRDQKRFKLIITGTGSEEKRLQQTIKEEKDTIEWVGYVTEEKKYKQLLPSSHILFFPTYCQEGLPLTILEGISYGLPIISRPVGGIPDIVKEGENGYLIKSLSPEENASKIMEILETPDLYQTMSLNNIALGKQFEMQIVRDRIYSYYKEVYSMNK